MHLDKENFLEVYLNNYFFYLIMEEGENIVLSEDEIIKIKKILSELKFEDFKIHKYYFRDKFTQSYNSEPRHGIGLEELKGIFYRKSIIKRGFKRKTAKGNTYTLCYEESKNVFVKISYIFDENPPKIFSAMRIYRNLERAVKRKYGLSI